MSTEQALKRIENAEKELALAKEALIKSKILPNWYDGMPVLVKSRGSSVWTKRYLKKVDTSLESPFVCYLDGGCFGETVLAWYECKQDLDAPSLLNWIPYTIAGYKPNAKLVLVKHCSGNILCADPRNFTWSDIKEYAILIK